MMVYGRKPILEALKGGQNFLKLYLQVGISGSIVAEIRGLASKNKILFTEVSVDKLTLMCKSSTHQGVAALMEEQKSVELEEILENCKAHKFPLIVILENIQDTQNLGAIIRTSAAVGAQGVLITKHNSAPLNENAVKASAGASAHIPISMIHNVVQVMEKLKDEGFWIVGSTLADAIDYRKIDYKCPLAVIIGNEEKGIRQLTAEKCDFLAKIKMNGVINSLNASVAAGIILFEVSAQRDITE